MVVAATRQFCQRGFHHASMDDIAAEAGVSKPTLYRHFDDKRSMYFCSAEDAEPVADTGATGAQAHVIRSCPFAAGGLLALQITFSLLRVSPVLTVTKVLDCGHRTLEG